jgi:hypothetical protein
MFFHGFDNYMQYAFPEDELRPLTCAPLTRDRANPAHIELNDVLGNYSLTLVDSLSTLAIMADAKSRTRNGASAWSQFQNGVGHLVELYGDGSDDGVRGTGSRGKGFELDSKVQVFETVIRGLGEKHRRPTFGGENRVVELNHLLIIFFSGFFETCRRPPERTSFRGWRSAHSRL